MVFELAGASWTVLETPGHTPGCICWKLDAANALFAGDTLFRDSAGRTDLPGGNPRALTQSLRKLAALPDDLRVFSGHGQYGSPGFSHNRRWAWICCGPVCVCCCHVFRPTRPC